MGAFIGVLVAGTSTLLLVTVPAGIILCGAASAFAKVVDERRDDIISKVCGLPRRNRGESIDLSLSVQAAQPAVAPEPAQTDVLA
jgi:hypothetical protein